MAASYSLSTVTAGPIRRRTSSAVESARESTLVGASRRLDGCLRVAVAREALDVDVVRRQVLARRLVLHRGGVREALAERRLLAQRLG